MRTSLRALAVAVLLAAVLLAAGLLATPALAVAAPGTGLLFDAAQGDLMSHFDNSGNSGLVEDGQRAQAVRSPLDPARQALAFRLDGGGVRSEVLPKGRGTEPREGDEQWVRYTAVLGEDFPTDTPLWQVVLQWHQTSPNGSPPLALQITRGQLVMVSGGDDMRAIGPVRPGETVDLAMHIVFSQDPGTSSVTVLRDGRPTGVTDWSPRRGTMSTEAAYLKMGIYRTARIGQDARMTVTDLKIGQSRESLGATPAGAVDGALDAAGLGAGTGDGDDGDSGDSRDDGDGDGGDDGGSPQAGAAAVPEDPTSSDGGSTGSTGSTGTATTTASPTQRDVYAWPFAWNSIWNLPLATTARYGDFDPQVGNIYADVENITVDPDAPVRRLGGRGGGQGVHVDPDLTADGSWNNCSTLLVDSPDGRTIVQGQPMVLRAGGNPSWRVGWDAQSLTGDGTEGCHGGSGLSGIGGTIRQGELTADEPIRHALKVSLPCTTSCSAANGGFRWPAVKADAGYEGKYGGEDPAVNMGALLALPPDLDLSEITAPDVRKVAEALQTYGAYVVDETGGAPSGSFQVQSTAVREFRNIDSSQMRAVFNALEVVENNGPQSPGGGALDAPRRAACAPAFADGTGGAPATCGPGATAGEQDATSTPGTAATVPSTTPRRSGRRSRSG